MSRQSFSREFAFAAAVFSALMGSFAYAAHRSEPQASSLACSLIRVLSNWAVVIIPMLIAPQFRSKSWLEKKRALLLDGEFELFAWGVLGAITVICFFAANARIGAGQSALLQSSQGVFIVLLEPLVLGQRSEGWRLSSILAVTGSALGIGIVSNGFVGTHDSYWGVILGLTSGLTAAIGYLLIGRLDRQVSVISISFYWGIMALFAHVLLWLPAQTHWPIHFSTYLWMLGSGLSASLAQIFTAIALQTGPADEAAGMGYLSAIFNIGFDFLFFGIPFGKLQILGAMIVIFFGVLLCLRENVKQGLRLLEANLRL